MKINEIIRERRLTKGITQEQMASCLGVSAPAVNKWEKGVTYPDITLLPALARLLGTDLNTLLSFREELTTQEIAIMLNEIAEDASTNGLEHAYGMMMEQIHEYPNCDMLILNAAMTLEGLAIFSQEETARELIPGIEKLYRQAASSKDEKVSGQAKFLLISKFITGKEYGKAQELLDELPDRPAYDKEQLQANLYLAQEQYEEAARTIESKLLLATNTIQSALESLLRLAILEERTTDAEKIASVSSQMTELFGLWEYGSYVAPLDLALAQKDVNACLALLPKMFSSLLINWVPAESPLYRHLPVKEENMRNSPDLKEMMFSKLLDELEHPDGTEYDFLKDNLELQKILQDMRARSCS